MVTIFNTGHFVKIYNRWKSNFQETPQTTWRGPLIMWLFTVGIGNYGIAKSSNSIRIQCMAPFRNQFKSNCLQDQPQRSQRTPCQVYKFLQNGNVVWRIHGTILQAIINKIKLFSEQTWTEPKNFRLWDGKLHHIGHYFQYIPLFLEVSLNQLNKCFQNTMSILKTTPGMHGIETEFLLKLKSHWHKYSDP